MSAPSRSQVDPALPAPEACRVFERPQRIRFAHCDAAGIVFFPQYFVLFNGLIEDFFGDALGIPFAHLIGHRRIGIPIVSLGCEFRAISRMGDDVTLGLAIERVGESSLTLDLRCRAGDETRVTSRQVLVTTSIDTHRAISIPGDLRDALAKFQLAGD